MVQSPAHAPLPARLEPQLCSASSSAPSGSGWIHELKYDGWRMLCRRDGDVVRLYTRGGYEWSARLPALVRDLRALPCDNAWLDGELVHLDADGFPNFDALHESVNGSAQARLFYQLWDVAWLDGERLARHPLLDRKERLAVLLRDASPRIRYTAHIEGDGRAVFEGADRLGAEGIVSKRASGRYAEGQRTRDWLKVKAWRRYRFVIGGFQWDRAGQLEALLVGTPAGRRLRYAGRVELGLSRLNGAHIPVLARLLTRTCPFVGEWASARRTWLRPRAWVDVRALPLRDGQLLRHAMLVAPTSKMASTAMI